MVENQGPSKFQEKRIYDYLDDIGGLFYIVAGILFVSGLYVDLAMSGQILIPPFAIADEPNANSGLFIAAILLGILGLMVSRLGTLIETRQTEEAEEEQEWNVDI